MTGFHGPRSSSQPVISGCLSRWPYSSTQSSPVLSSLAGMSMKISGVRFSSRTTSSCMPGIGCARAQASISLTASSM